jgi:hypothetical protein
MTSRDATEMNSPVKPAGQEVGILQHIEQIQGAPAAHTYAPSDVLGCTHA